MGAGCGAESIEFPMSSVTIQENRPLSDKASGADQDVTQIQPQKLHLTLRPGMTATGTERGRETEGERKLVAFNVGRERKRNEERERN